MFEDDWAEERLKKCFLRQSYAKYLEQLEKSSTTGEDKKSLIFTFACFLTATVKV